MRTLNILSGSSRDRVRRVKVSSVLWVVLCVSMLAAAALPLQPAAALAPYQRRIIELASGRLHSHVALGDLDGDGVDDIVVGGLDGVVSAYRGNGSRLWTYNTGTASMEGKAAIGDINNDGRNEVIVGVGSTFTPGAPGGVLAFSHDGRLLWRYASKDFFGDGNPEGVYASPLLADVNPQYPGKLEIIYGGWDGYIRVLNHDGSLFWERFVRDTIWSSPAIGDITGDGKLEIAIGTDAHYEPAFGTVDGGRLMVVRAQDGSDVPGFPIPLNETVWSSPILVDLTGDGWLDILVGTGNCWTVPECAVPPGNTHPVTKALYGWDRTGKPLPGWPIRLPEYTMASPSVADLNKDGALEVVINSADGYVHAFRANGTYMPGWPVRVTTPVGPGQVVHHGTIASTILADLTGNGLPEIIVPSNWEMVVFDINGVQLTRDNFPSTKWDLSTEYALIKTAAVGDVDGDGTIELVAAGARSGGAPGAIYIWDFSVKAHQTSMPWPMARLNTHNTASSGLAPSLATSVSPDGVLLMHAYGTGSSLSFQIRISSTTADTIEWEIRAPASLSVSSTQGLASAGGSVVTVQVSVRDLGIRSTPYSLGNLEISGTYGGSPVPNSPLVIPVRVLVAREIFRSYSPLVRR
jgi:hypothetical protein